MFDCLISTFIVQATVDSFEYLSLLHLELSYFLISVMY